MPYSVNLPGADVGASYAREAARRGVLAENAALHPNCEHDWTPWSMGMFQNDVRTCKNCGRQEFD